MSDIKPDQKEEHKERKGRPPYCMSEEKKKDGFKAKWTGQCYCGNVQYELDQDPVDACYCHCRTCQRTHGATYQWAAIVPKDAMHFKSGEDNLHFYSTNHKKMEYVLPCKVSCGMCQSPIMDEGRNMCLIFPGLIHGMHEGELKHNGPFKASHHMFYESCVEDIANDDIAKFSGKKGEGPMNAAAEKMMPEIKKKQAEKEEKKKREKEDSDKEGEGSKDDSSKKQKKE